jgi:Glucokinase
MWCRPVSGGCANRHIPLSDCNTITFCLTPRAKVWGRQRRVQSRSGRVTAPRRCHGPLTARRRLVGGGIVPRLGAFFDASAFRPRFESKRRLSDYVRPIPTFVISAANPGLIGAAMALAEA